MTEDQRKAYQSACAAYEAEHAAHRQAVDALMSRRKATGLKYHALLCELLDTVVTLAALDIATSCRKAGNRHNDQGFVNGDLNELPRMLGHAHFSPRATGRRLTAEINEMVAELVEPMPSPPVVPAAPSAA